jgi:hypothetical protein
LNKCPGKPNILSRRELGGYRELGWEVGTHGEIAPLAVERRYRLNRLKAVFRPFPRLPFFPSFMVAGS